MADVQINDLTNKVTPVSTDEVELQATAGGASAKATLANLSKAITITESQISDFGTYSTATGVENNADVTDTANVTAAGALMDSEVDADIKTLSLPASTTISTFGASLIDDTTNTAARTTLGLGTLATANNVNNGNWSGTDLSVPNGGTGVSTLASGNFLQGNGTSAVTATKAVPTGVVVGTTDTQTLTNKTLTAPTLTSPVVSTAIYLPPQMDVYGSTSGFTRVQPQAVASGTLSLPAATDTLVGRDTTDTLTNKTLTSAVLNTGISGTAVLDEDNMASDSATKLATQQSIKAYVDTQNPQYSTSETDTGKKWTDGSTIYRKVINTTFTAISGATNVAHGISGLTSSMKMISVSGGFNIGSSSDSTKQRLHYREASGNWMNLESIDTTNVVVRASFAWGTSRLILVLEYVK